MTRNATSVLPRQGHNGLLPSDIRRHLETRWLGRELRCLDVVDSTNTVARDWARSGAPNGAVVIAESQTHGRGRFGRHWISPPYRNLYLSTVLRSAVPVERFPQMSLLAGVATCEAICEWHAAAIKWPNDVVIDGRKVAGILAEADSDRGQRVVVLGIGVNVNAQREDFPPELRDKAGSLAMALGHSVDRARVAGRLLTHLERRFEQWRDEGFARIAEAWRARSDLLGREIVVQEPGGAVAGRAIDLDDDGALRLRLASGAEHRVVAGDVIRVLGVAGREIDGRRG